MIYKFEYLSDYEKENIIKSNIGKYLVEEQNLIEGNFLIFSDTKPTEIIDEIEGLKNENTILKAKNNALAERADFVEDLIAEMAMQVYQ